MLSKLLLRANLILSIFICVSVIAFFNNSLMVARNYHIAADYYFNLSSRIFDAEKFFHNVNECPTPLQHDPDNGRDCIRESVSLVGGESLLCKMKFESQPTCNYDIKLDFVLLEERDFIYYVFSINQFDCSKCKQVRGGSTFEFYAYNRLNVVRCYTLDNLSNNYTVLCQFPNYADNAFDKISDKNSETSCISITAILSQEYFNSFAEATCIQSPHTLNYIIADDETYCATTASHSGLKRVRERVVSTSTLPLGVTWYGGSWVTDEALVAIEKVSIKAKKRTSSSSKSCFENEKCYTSLMEYEHRVGLTNSAYLYQVNQESSIDFKGRKRLINYTAMASRVRDRHRLPSIAILPPDVMADKYTFLPEVVHRNTGKSNPNLVSEFVFSYSYNQDKEVINRGNWTYLFFGSSHMRYTYDAVVAYLLGIDSMKSLSNHHLGVTIGKYKFDAIPFSANLADTVERHCKALPTNRRQMLILQTGHWDLFYYGLRYAIKYSARKLLRTMERVFSGKLSCPSVNHIVWLTSVPFPTSRSGATFTYHRTNANLKALNEFYVNSLLTLYNSFPGANKRVKLSIIDVFNIIAPRLMFNEDNEVVGENPHYTLKVDPYTHPNLNHTIHKSARRIGSRHSHQGHRAHQEQAVIVTPGGSAVVQSVLLVIKSSIFTLLEV